MMSWVIVVRIGDGAAYDAAVTVAKERGLTEIRSLGQFTILEFTLPVETARWWAGLKAGAHVRGALAQTPIYHDRGVTLWRSVTPDREMVVTLIDGDWIQVLAPQAAFPGGLWVRGEETVRPGVA